MGLRSRGANSFWAAGSAWNTSGILLTVVRCLSERECSRTWIVARSLCVTGLSLRAGGCGAWVFETPHFVHFMYRMTFKILKP